MTLPPPELTDYGFQDIPRDQKQSLVKNLFAGVAKSYDLMNDLMSLGLHRCWKRRFIYRLALAPNHHVLDVAAGTGDISLLIRQTFPYLNITSHLVDLTPEMIDEGRKKAINLGILNQIRWHVSPAEDLPIPDNSMDIYTISFGLRNVSNRQKVLQEAFRVLKPGGRFYCLEFSHVNKTYLKKAYAFYSFNVLPAIGKYVANDRPAYQYLVESIQRFPTAEKLAQELVDAGFCHVLQEPWAEGIVAIHTAQEPL